MTQSINARARDTRWHRAGTTVLAQYRIVAAGTEDGRRVFQLSGGSKPYTVRIHEEWKAGPSCTCPDWEDGARRGNAGYCKHVIGVLLKHPDLSHQLLELFL
jgi:uncharacterized Zn finger protein